MADMFSERTIFEQYWNGWLDAEHCHLWILSRLIYHGGHATGIVDPISVLSPIQQHKSEILRHLLNSTVMRLTQQQYSVLPNKQVHNPTQQHEQHVHNPTQQHVHNPTQHGNNTVLLNNFLLLLLI